MFDIDPIHHTELTDPDDQMNNPCFFAKANFLLFHRDLSDRLGAPGKLLGGNVHKLRTGKHALPPPWSAFS
jgi:hypothetical protein